MEENIEIEVATLKKKINIAIENEEFVQAEILSNRLCELQGLDTNVTMPRDFIFRLKLKERKSEKMKLKKKIFKVAAALLIIGVTGSTAYAAVQHFRNVQQMEYGLITESADVNVGANGDSSMENSLLSDAKVSTDILSTESGSEGMKWISKEVRKETHSTYYSDDRINWKEEENVVDVTEYTYKDYETAYQDTNMPNIFNNVYTLNGNVQYTEYIHEEDTAANMAELVSNFKYANGEFTLDKQKNLNWDGIEVDNAVITSTTPSTNQREYISDNGNLFELSDDIETGVTRTTVLVSYDEYSDILTFINLSDDEIHKILDSITVNE